MKIFNGIRYSIHLLLCLIFLVVYCNIGINLTKDLVKSKNISKIPRDVLSEYNYLKAILDAPDKKAKTTTDGLSNFMSSEWPIMTLSLGSYGMSNLAKKSPALKNEVSLYIRKAIERAKKPEYYNFVVDHYGDPFHSKKIKDNAFYLGHFVLMLALYREVSGDNQYDELFHKFAHAFYQNFKQSPTFCLTSYAELTWTSEQVVPFRALKIHDDIFGTNYREVIYQWQDMMEKHFMDSKAGLLITSLDNKTGQIFEGPRTIANAWTILFLHDILPDFCKKLYFNMKKELMVTRLGFPMFKEWAEEKQYATGDTGPILWDVSAVSTAFGIGSAAVMGDDLIFRATRYLSSVLAMEVSYLDKSKYLVGGQIGTAAMFWIKSMEIVTDNPKQAIPLKSIIFLYFFLAIVILLNVWLFFSTLNRWKSTIGRSCKIGKKGKESRLSTDILTS